MTSKEELAETIQRAAGDAYMNGMDAADIEVVLNQAMRRVEALEEAEKVQ